MQQLKARQATETGSNLESRGEIWANDILGPMGFPIPAKGAQKHTATQSRFRKGFT